eukprot:290769-Alexandrium_andersonii.AAC.1
MDVQPTSPAYPTNCLERSTPFRGSVGVSAERPPDRRTVLNEMPLHVCSNPSKLTWRQKPLNPLSA